MASWVVFANAKIISGRRIFLSPLNRLILRQQPDESSEDKEAKKDNRWCWSVKNANGGQAIGKVSRGYYAKKLTPYP